MKNKNLFEIIRKKIWIFILAAICIVTVAAHADNSGLKIPSASGTTVMKNDKAAVDASNSSEGYVMIKYTGGKDVKVKAIIEKNGGTKYTYDVLNKGSYETFPLSEGKGTYKVTVYENAGGTKYTTAFGTSVSSNMSDDYTTFLYPNQYAWYTANSNVVKKAKEIVGSKSKELDKVAAVYDYVVNNFSYDYDKAKTVKSGYVPNPDSILSSKKGICLDYASVMVSMLRSQDVPTKLVVGYAGDTYHAWINVYVKDVGWLDNVIYFDGKNWELVDPTFASTSSSKTSYKPEQSKYSTKFVYWFCGWCENYISGINIEGVFLL